MLDLVDHPDKACYIAVIPQDAVLSDCDSDKSDMDYEGEIGQPSYWMHMLNICKQIMTGTTSSAMMTSPSPSAPPLPHPPHPIQHHPPLLMMKS